MRLFTSNGAQAPINTHYVRNQQLSLACRLAFLKFSTLLLEQASKGRQRSPPIPSFACPAPGSLHADEIDSQLMSLPCNLKIKSHIWDVLDCHLQSCVVAVTSLSVAHSCAGAYWVLLISWENHLFQHHCLGVHNASLTGSNIFSTRCKCWELNSHGKTWKNKCNTATSWSWTASKVLQLEASKLDQWSNECSTRQQNGSKRKLPR